MVETTFKVTLPIGLKKLLEEVGSSIVSAECLEYLPEDARMNLIAGVLLERKAQSIVRLRESNGRVQRELRESAVQKPEVKLEPQAEQKVEKKAKKPKAPQAVPFTLEQLPGESQLAFLRRKIPEYIKKYGDCGASAISRSLMGSDQPNHLTQTYTALKSLTKDGTIIRDSSGAAYIYRVP